MVLSPKCGGQYQSDGQGLLEKVAQGQALDGTAPAEQDPYKGLGIFRRS